MVSIQTKIYWIIDIKICSKNFRNILKLLFRPTVPTIDHMLWKCDSLLRWSQLKTILKTNIDYVLENFNWSSFDLLGTVLSEGNRNFVFPQITSKTNQIQLNIHLIDKLLFPFPLFVGSTQFWCQINNTLFINLVH